MLTRGFTLMELILALIVSSLLVLVAAPQFASLHEHLRMRRMATSLKGFLAHARTEAVMRNQELYIHVDASSNPALGWKVRLSSNPDGESDDPLNISVLTGNGNTLKLNATGSAQKIAMDRINGKPLLSGNLEFAYLGQHSERLHLKFSTLTGRIRVCAVEKKLYGYKKC